MENLGEGGFRFRRVIGVGDPEQSAIPTEPGLYVYQDASSGKIWVVIRDELGFCQRILTERC